MRGLVAAIIAGTHDRIVADLPGRRVVCRRYPQGYRARIFLRDERYADQVHAIEAALFAEPKVVSVLVMDADGEPISDGAVHTVPTRDEVRRSMPRPCTHYVRVPPCARCRQLQRPGGAL